MNLLQTFNAFIKKENLFTKKDALLLAVSGGADSVVLCELCKQSGYEFSIAHCNFNLRGEESLRDENFVKALGESYGVTTFIKNFDTVLLAKEYKTSIEETARNLRYQWFEELMTENTDNIQKNIVRKLILTAHHADDNIETVMMNFFRGTGIKGLRGILPKQGKIIRPLLFAGRKDIELFASENNITFVTDSSNNQSDYTRNYFRNELIPSIEKVFPETKKNLLQNINRFIDIEFIYEESIAAIKQKLVEKNAAEMHISIMKLAKTKPMHTVIYEIIKDYGFVAAQVSELKKLMSSTSGKYILSPTHRILNNRKWLIITPLQHDESNFYLLEENLIPQQISFAAGQINIDRSADASLTTDTNTAVIDTNKITFPLLLRKWKQGDYFYPLGMQKKKKLSRFFIDQKLSLPQKENCWVVESDKKIIWIVGMRIDDRFKITAATIKRIRIVFLPSQ